jgi:hypothetical protein
VHLAVCAFTPAARDRSVRCRAGESLSRFPIWSGFAYSGICCSTLTPQFPSDVPGHSRASGRRICTVTVANFEKRLDLVSVVALRRESREDTSPTFDRATYFQEIVGDSDGKYRNKRSGGGNDLVAR